MKYFIDKNIMNDIDSEEKAYWLGFFYADAYNNEKRGRIVLELAEKDEDHLLKCAKFFGNPRKPFRQFKNKNKYVSYRLELNSKYLSEVLKNKGCSQNKSFIINFPDWLKPEFVNHFIRGYFDGDGCIYIHQNQLVVEIVSTNEMIESIQKILAYTVGINSQIRRRKKYKQNTVVLYSGGSKQIKKFCEWLYKDANIFMQRKYQIYTNYFGINN